MSVIRDECDSRRVAMTETALAHVGDDLHDPGGHKIGKITDVIVDDRVLQPEWYVVRVGMIKGNHLVPAGTVAASDIGWVVPYDKALVQSTPKLVGLAPSEAEQEVLCAHYRVPEWVRLGPQAR
jgi:hypothetical protein